MALSFKEPHSIRATYRIVTPMFIGDAEQKASGISPASVKGALRFWWRALMWGKVGDLKELHKQESALFGSSADKGNAAAFTLRVISEKLTKTTTGATHSEFTKQAAARYLGYGLMEAFASRAKGTQAGQLVRDCLNENQTFTVTLTSFNPLEDSLKQALMLFGLIGGLGSRTRHGMGSITLEALHEKLPKQAEKQTWSAPKTNAEYTATIHGILSNLSTIAQPPFSAFSQETRIDLLEKSATPYDALNAFGKKMLLYRSWGKDGKVLNEPSEKRFKADHDWSKGHFPRDFHPKRVIFGLPHNYGKGERLSIVPESHDRRASPLFFHVHKVGSEYIGISLLLPSTFLPQGEKINAGGTNVPAKIEWSVLTDFLDGNDNKGNVRFQGKQSIVSGVTIR
ncbi:MAG: type III-B CRISPR module RAMP protein Cmr1 [Thiothrix sp.]|uniref:type III-B CRISPR module RAMP protein Cmr1 n=1 Tax=Thiothrix sp. TaxID=1032 RepID=UPI002635B21F|nr:type III-B CRISPR module RAMP protein Cmr1 [Thiothrix sp.]MDD5392737.1 type III-B CRISPR module RAMP protein Cmr1 [Thiothrix sp.]